jgi:hypothetical protein
MYLIIELVLQHFLERASFGVNFFLSGLILRVHIVQDILHFDWIFITQIVEYGQQGLDLGTLHRLLLTERVVRKGVRLVVVGLHVLLLHGDVDFL